MLYLLCMMQEQILSLQVVENVKDNLNQNIYKTIIPRNVRLAEAPSYGMPINLYDPKSTGNRELYAISRRSDSIKEKNNYAGEEKWIR